MNKKYFPQITIDNEIYYVKDKEAREELEYQVNKLLDAFPTETSTGQITATKVGANMIPPKSVSITILPEQNLNGYDCPWPDNGLNGGNIWDTYKYPLEQGAISSTTGQNSTSSSTRVRCVGGVSDEQKVPVTGGVTYTIKAGGTAASCYIFEYDSNEAYTNISSNWQSLPYTFTVDSGTSFIRFVLRNSNSTAIVPSDVGWVTIVEGTSAIPYSNICNFSGKAGINIQHTKKNLLNIEDASTGSSNCRWGGLTYADGTFVLPAGTYTLSANFAMTGFYIKDSSGDLIKVVYNNTACTFTLTERQPILIDVYLNTTVSDWTIFEFQLELNSNATIYEPYQEITIPILWQSQAGMVYGATLFDNHNGTWTLTRDWEYAESNASGQMVFATSGIAVDLSSNTTNRGYVYYNCDAEVKPYSTSVGNGLCNMLSTSSISGDNKECFFPYQTGGGVGRLGFRIEWLPGWNTATSNLSASEHNKQLFKDWLASEHAKGNKLQVIYKLVTPISYTLSAESVKSFLANNTLWSDTGNLTAIWRCDPTLYIDSKIALLTNS